MKGNKPDYHLSMGGEQSETFYKEFLQQMAKSYNPDKIKGIMTLNTAKTFISMYSSI